MKIIFQCGCGEQITAQPYLAGKQIQCPSCQAIVPVPNPALPPTVDPSLKTRKAERDKASPSQTENTGASSPGSIVVACQCGQRFQAPPQLIGRNVKCPSCGGPIAVRAGPSNVTGSNTVAASDPPLIVNCQCGTRLQAPSYLFGKQVCCPACQQPVSIPFPNERNIQRSPVAAPMDDALWDDVLANDAMVSALPAMAPLASAPTTMAFGPPTWNAPQRKRFELKLPLIPLALLSWLLPPISMMLSVMITVVALPLAAIGGLVFLGGVFCGFVLSIVCLVMSREQRIARGHAIAGLIVSSLFGLMLACILPAVQHARHLARIRGNTTFDTGRGNQSGATYESPQAVTDAHFNAIRSTDWRTVFLTYAPESRRDLVAEQVLNLQRKIAEDESVSKRFSKYGITLSAAPLERRSSWKTTASDLEQAYQIADQINDPAGFFVESNKVVIALNFTFEHVRGEGGKTKMQLVLPERDLKNLTITGDTATARLSYQLSGGHMTQLVRFRKIDDSWFIQYETRVRK